VLLWAVLGVVLIMLSTYYAGEYWDYEEDQLSGETGGSRFAGGSQVLQRGQLPRRAALRASLVTVALALVVGLVIQFGYRTGPGTLPLGLLGILGGFFYSTRPIRWVARGFGELWIAFCYGWLPIATGYYLQVGTYHSLIHWMAVPVGLSIFNVILLNEFPDFHADRAADKLNLTVRVGRVASARIYSLLTVSSWVGVWLSVQHGVPGRLLYGYLPVGLLSAALAMGLLRDRWRVRAVLEMLCAANLVVNLGTTASYILAFVS
jgi:1,4-dihydroxy-2-naphthoate octaprenyltransferase